MKERDTDFKISYHTLTKEITDPKTTNRLQQKENTDSKQLTDSNGKVDIDSNEKS